MKYFTTLETFIKKDVYNFFFFFYIKLFTEAGLLRAFKLLCKCSVRHDLIAYNARGHVNCELIYGDILKYNDNQI